MCVGYKAMIWYFDILLSLGWVIILFFFWLSPGTLVPSTNKTDRHDTTEILLKVALNTIKQYILQYERERLWLDDAEPKM